MTDKRCETCVFFNPDKHSNDGYCHRYPPLTRLRGGSGDHSWWVQPEVLVSDWCGEFQPKGE